MAGGGSDGLWHDVGYDFLSFYLFFPPRLLFLPYAIYVCGSIKLTEQRLGPSELVVTGNLRNWTCIPNIHKIKVPTLMINGVEDEVQDVTMRPFFEHIDKVKWIVLDGAAHLSHVDQRVKYMGVVREFLGSV